MATSQVTRHRWIQVMTSHPPLADHQPVRTSLDLPETEPVEAQ
jgi:hypothetical protein